MHKLRKKIKLASIGFGFIILNLLSVILNYDIIGFVFGSIAFYFIVKSLIIKEDGI